MNEQKNRFLTELLTLQQDGKGAISAPSNWWEQPPLLKVATAIDTDIKDLRKNILKRENNSCARWHFFIGSPGNGKSAAIGKLCRDLVDNDSCTIKNSEGENIRDIDSESVPYLFYVYEKDKKYATAKIIQDASVVPNPYADNIDPAKELISVIEGAWNEGISLVVCANRGVLEQACQQTCLEGNRDNKHWISIIKNLVEGAIQEKQCSFGNRKKTKFEEVKVTFTELDDRSILSGDCSSNVYSKIIEEAVHKFRWNVCKECSLAPLCPFKANRDWLDNNDAKVNFIKVLRRAEVLSGQIIVLREALALLSFILSGCPKDYGDLHPCEWVRRKVKDNDIFSLAMRRIYMNVYASFTRYGLENDRKLRKEQESMLKKLVNNHCGNDENTNKYVKHIFNSGSLSSDVGVTRLTGEKGLFAELDPCNECLDQDFFDRWLGEFDSIDKNDSSLITDIERECIKIWSSIEDLIESTPTHESTKYYWALRRWSSNFTAHFGALSNGMSRWSKELDLYITNLGAAHKNVDEWSANEKEAMKGFRNLLKSLLFFEDDNNKYIKLSKSTTLHGDWVSENLRPEVDIGETKKYKNLSIVVGLGNKDKSSRGRAVIGARMFIWLIKKQSKKLNIKCFPMELLTGFLDAMVRASSSGLGYAVADDDVELKIDADKGEVYKLKRSFGEVDVSSD